MKQVIFFFALLMLVQTTACHNTSGEAKNDYDPSDAGFVFNSLLFDRLDVTPPRITSSTITFSDITTTAIALNDTCANDDSGLGTNYVYRFSTSNNISTLSTLNLNGQSASTSSSDFCFNQSGGTGKTTLSGLTTGTTYFFNIRVDDKRQNYAVYTSSSATTN